MSDTMGNIKTGVYGQKDNIFVNAAFLINEILYNATCVAADSSMQLIMMEKVCKEKDKDDIKHLRVIDRNHVKIEESTLKSDSTSLLAAAMAAHQLGYADSDVTVLSEDKSIRVSLA